MDGELQTPVASEPAGSVAVLDAPATLDGAPVADTAPDSASAAAPATVDLDAKIREAVEAAVKPHQQALSRKDLEVKQLQQQLALYQRAQQEQETALDLEDIEVALANEYLGDPERKRLERQKAKLETRRQQYAQQNQSEAYIAQQWDAARQQIEARTREVGITPEDFEKHVLPRWNQHATAGDPIAAVIECREALAAWAAKRDVQSENKRIAELEAELKRLKNRDAFEEANRDGVLHAEPRGNAGGVSSGPMSQAEFDAHRRDAAYLRVNAARLEAGFNQGMIRR